jgi:predicted ABC-type sugar transport system permease subunit
MLSGLALIGAGTCHPASAEMDAKRLLIVAKVFDFVRDKPRSGARVVVVTGAANVAAVRAALGRFQIVEGSVGDVAGAFAVFVNSTSEARAARSLNSAILSIGSDVGCVNDGACVLAVETRPRVSVFVSQAAASGAGISFDTSFLMLISER